MAKPEWGDKRCCPKCASKFYDMKKRPAVCPVCNFSFDPEAPVKRRTKRKSVKMKGEDAAEKVLAASNKAMKSRDEVDLDDDDALDLPEIEDLDIIEDIDDLDDDMDTIKPKSGSKEEDDVSEETFIKGNKILDSDEEEDEPDEDEDDEDK